MFGTDDIVSAVTGIAGKVIDRVWPDPAQAAAAKLELFKMQQSGELAQLAANTDLAKGQLAVNTAEAANPNMFISGWRPFIGWVCGLGLLSQFLVRPMSMFIAEAFGHVLDFPSLELGTLLTLLFGMLGLGAMRTGEKMVGVAAK